MRVQATKKMANELNKALKGTRFEKIMRFDAREVSFEFYAREVSSNWEEMEMDYDARTGKYRTMRVAYNPNLYAMGQFITTRDLNKIFRDIQFYNTCPTFEDFAKGVFEQYEI